MTERRVIVSTRDGAVLADLVRYSLDNLEAFVTINGHPYAFPTSMIVDVKRSTLANFPASIGHA